MSNRLKHAKNIYDSSVENNEYNSEQNLNWRDDGDVLNDPSMNDYLKGYNVNPYEFKQWAQTKGVFKSAAMEVDNMQYMPWYLSDKILTLWNGADGPLQNFYEAFTLRYDNKLKKEIAGFLGEAGYKVYPVLTDDKPRYARNERIRKIVTNSKGLSKFAEEITELKDSGEKVTQIDAAGILEYFKQIFPEDFATQLVFIDIEDPEKNKSEFDPYKDYSISDESLEQIENTMSGNADPFGSNKGSGGQFGYDATTNMNSDISVAPNQYETRLSKKKHC